VEGKLKQIMQLKTTDKSLLELYSGVVITFKENPPTEEQIRQEFSKFGEINSIQVDPQNSNCFWIDYYNIKSAREAVLQTSIPFESQYSIEPLTYQNIPAKPLSEKNYRSNHRDRGRDHSRNEKNNSNSAESQYYQYYRYYPQYMYYMMQQYSNSAMFQAPPNQQSIPNQAPPEDPRLNQYRQIYDQVNFQQYPNMPPQFPQ